MNSTASVYNSSTADLITFTYGADGLRTKKTVNGTTTEYTYASGLLVSQSDRTTTLNFTYSPDGIPRTVTYGNAQYYYLYNLQGDVTGIYNSQGSSEVEYTYDTWGKLISVTGRLASTLGAKNPFRYRGYVYDTETGYYYLTTRYYDPETGRFLNANGYISTGEPLTGYNMFAYCYDNPVNMKDSEGNRPIATTSIQEETRELRKSSCNWQKRVTNYYTDEQYYATVFMSQTDISQNSDNPTEYVAIISFENDYVRQYLNMDVAYEYSEMLERELDIINIRDGVSRTGMSSEHIFSELLTHYYPFVVFDELPILQKIANGVYDIIKEADMNASENRLDVYMWIISIFYKGYSQ